MKAYLCYLLIPVFVILSALISTVSLSDPQHVTSVVRLDLPKTIDYVKEKTESTAPRFNQSAFFIPKGFRDKKIMIASNHDRIITTTSPAKGVTNSTIMLSALLVDEDVRLAYINGALVEEGERVAEYKVVSIDKQGVWLIGPGGRKRVVLEYN